MKIILMALILIGTVGAKSLVYRVKAPLFGTIGKVTIDYSSSKKYQIRAHMQTLGFAKTLSGDRIESYSSSGFVENGVYKAKEFKQNVTYKDKRIHLSYTFRYAAKKIYKTRIKWKDNKVLSSTKHDLSYFTFNDLFSVYHNIVKRFNGGRMAGEYEMKVAGMEAHNGILHITIPPIATQQKETKELGVRDAWIFHVVTYRKILGSKNGEIIFAVGEDGIAKAVRVLNTSYVSHVDAFLVD